MNISKAIKYSLTILLILWVCSCGPRQKAPDKPQEIEERVAQLLAQMTLEEKIGQLMQKNGDHPHLDSLIKGGRLGSVINQPNPEKIYQLQKIAVEQSRLGIPLLIGRDVIHGFKTIFPIPLGQAASWNTKLVEQASRVAALEATSQGIRWSFAPMIDLTRDPRWGRIAECFGEDPYLNGIFGAAVVRGFQGDDLSHPSAMAACVKHYAAYGWAEGGRDYNTVSIAENDLYDLILPPFRMSLAAGAASIMTAFNEINGIPATGHIPLLRDLLRREWGFEGVVLSDWQSLTQMVVHGYTPNHREAAYQAMQATLDMEMASTAYEDHLAELIKAGRIKEKQIDEAVKRILRLKYQLGLFDHPFAHMQHDFPELLHEAHLQQAKQLAAESVVMLKNEDVLPLGKAVKRIAVIGPLADAPHDQLGTWIFDGEKKDAITPLQSIREYAQAQNIHVDYHRALELSRSKTISNPQAILRDARQADVVLLFLGEESILSGESHSRADINLPGAQEELVQLLAQTGKPLAVIILAGRPLTFEKTESLAKAILYAWHPGTMAGPALTDILFGKISPSGKLPVTFPRHVGQIPIYYNHKNTGKPATDASWERLDDIPAEAPQLSIGNTSHYLDYGFEPMYPFGYGLSYASFQLGEPTLDRTSLKAGDKLQIRLSITNTGNMEAAEVVQLYTRQLFGSRTRPLRELRAFEKIILQAGETREIVLTLDTRDLAFHNQQMQQVVEAGAYQLWVGTCSRSGTPQSFEIIN